MAQDQPKDWRKLCEAAEKEPDPDKLFALVQQIIAALDEHDQKRKGDLRHETKIKIGFLAGECVTRKSLPDEAPPRLPRTTRLGDQVPSTLGKRRRTLTLKCLFSHSSLR